MSREVGNCHSRREKDAIPPEKLVLGDLMLLSSGEQIPSDAEESCPVSQEANEAMLTGESPGLKKKLVMNCFLEVLSQVVRVYAWVKRGWGKQLCQQADDGSQNLEAYQFLVFSIICENL